MSDTEAQSAEKIATQTEQFDSYIKSVEEQVFAHSRLQIESSNPNEKRSLRRAVRHAAGLKIMQDKFNSGSSIHLHAVFNPGINAHCVYFNDKPIAEASDNLIVWKASMDVLNRKETAESVAYTLAVMLTVLGHEVLVNGSKEPFDPFIQGRNDE